MLNGSLLCGGLNSHSHVSGVWGAMGRAGCRIRTLLQELFMPDRLLGRDLWSGSSRPGLCWSACVGKILKEERDCLR